VMELAGLPPMTARGDMCWRRSSEKTQISPLWFFFKIIGELRVLVRLLTMCGVLMSRNILDASVIIW